MNNAHKFITLAFGAVLAGCGGGGYGGGGGSMYAPQSFAAQGLWAGNSSAGTTINAVILETGELWSISSLNGTVYGLDHGTVTLSGASYYSSGTSYAGNITEYNIPNGAVTPGSISGTFVPQTSLNATSAFAEATFSATYSTAYDTPASLSALAGTYSHADYNGNPVSVSVNATGAFSGSSGSCTFSGTATPRSSGKNVFNIAATFNGGSCALGTKTVNGVGILTVSGSVKQFTVAALLPDDSNGFFWIGQN